MSIPVFQAGRDQLVAGASVLLGGAEGHHAATVRRLRAGEPLLLTDGRGTAADCVVVEVGRAELVVAVGRVEVTAAPAPRLVVVQALPKGDRGEVAVETLTEVGADLIVPWAAGRSVSQWKGERGGKALERWRSTAREAAKQSRRTWWPEVAALATTGDVVAMLSEAAFAAVLHEAATAPLSGAALPADGDLVLVIGPEGGIDERELEAFAAAGAAAYRLGPTVLRTSTAGTVAAAVVLAASRRWA